MSLLSWSKGGSSSEKEANSNADAKQRLEKILGLLRQASELSEEEVSQANTGVTHFHKEASEHCSELEKSAEDLGTEEIPDLAAISRAMQELMSEGLVEQTTHVGEAVGAAEVIQHISTDVDLLARNAKFLGINLQIECARLGDAGHTIDTCAGIWTHFAADLATLNSRIKQVATSVLTTLPEIESMANQLHQLSSDESERACTAFDSIRDRLELQQSSLVGTTRAATKRAERIRDTADQVLTNLQFQDRMRQVHNAVQQEVAELGRALGIPLKLDLIEPQPQMSGDTDASVAAGDITV